MDKALSWTLRPIIQLTNWLTTAKARQPFILTVYGSLSGQLSQLQHRNASVSLVLLIDRQGKDSCVVCACSFDAFFVGLVRWQATGEPSPNELHYLTNHIEKLLKN